MKSLLADAPVHALTVSLASHVSHPERYGAACDMSSDEDSFVKSVTPSPEPAQGGDGTFDDNNSFLDDFDPSDGEQTRLQDGDTSAWLNGSHDALSPELDNVTNSPKLSDGGSFEFATPEGAWSVGKSRHEAYSPVGQKSSVKTKLSFEDDEDVAHTSPDVSIGQDTVPDANIFTPPGHVGPPQTPAGFRDLGVGPEQWTEQALNAMHETDSIETLKSEVARFSIESAARETLEVFDDKAVDDDITAVVQDAEVEIAEMREAVTELALEESRKKVLQVDDVLEEVEASEVVETPFVPDEVEEDLYAQAVSSEAVGEPAVYQEVVEEVVAEEEAVEEEVPEEKLPVPAPVLEETSETVPEAVPDALVENQGPSGFAPEEPTFVSQELGSEPPQETDTDTFLFAMETETATRNATAEVLLRDAELKINSVETSMREQREEKERKRLAEIERQQQQQQQKDSDDLARLELKKEAHALQQLEREAQEAETAARAMLAAAARKREAVAAAAAAAAVRTPMSPKVTSVFEEDGHASVSQNPVLEDEASQSDASSDVTSDSPASAIDVKSLSTKEALARVKNARRRELLLRRTLLERDAVATELARRNALERERNETRKETSIVFASTRALSTPSPKAVGTSYDSRTPTSSLRLGSARRVSTRDALTRTRQDALEQANAKRLQRLATEEAANKPSPRRPSARFGRSSLTPPSGDSLSLSKTDSKLPGYLRAIASPATSGMKQCKSTQFGSPVQTPYSPSPLSRRPWGFHAPDEAKEAAARRIVTPLKTPTDAVTPIKKYVTPSTRRPLSSRANHGAVSSTVSAKKSNAAKTTPGPSPWFSQRVFESKQSLSKLKVATGNADAILDDGRSVLHELQSRGFDLDELSTVWTTSPSQLGGKDTEADDSPDVSSKTPVNVNAQSPSGSESSPLSEFERRFMTSYTVVQSPDSVNHKGLSATTEKAKRAVEKALDAIEGDDDDFEHFLSKYKMDSEMEKRNGRVTKLVNSQAPPATPETPDLYEQVSHRASHAAPDTDEKVQKAVRRAAADAALKARPGETVAAARAAAAAVKGKSRLGSYVSASAR